jgi:TPR repeat protein
MKKLLLILSCCWVYFVSAQFTSKPASPVKKYRSNYSKPKTIREDPNDSAYIYYRLGWDAYKAKDFGAARYFWEHGANCNTNIPSRYSSAFRLGLMHQEGEGVGINYEIAFYYFTLGYADARSEGDVDATKNIGAYYEMGRVVPQDNYKALEWYTRAKNQGNKYCNDDIARMKRKISQY